LAEWTGAGVWPRLHEVLLAKLRGANALDSSRAAVDGSHIRASKGGPNLPAPLDDLVRQLVRRRKGHASAAELRAAPDLAGAKDGKDEVDATPTL
jgi:transposase